ncbi:MAG: hypothetical protein GY760_01390 [Deltaproteobacteria bacterium]|nr:hypothetical protein [Deltaproteobacteria bacterium]
MKTEKKSYRLYILNLIALLLIITVVIVVANFYFRYTNSVLQLSNRIVKEVADKVITNANGFLKPVTTHVELTAKLIEDNNFKNIVNNQEFLLKYMWNENSISNQLLSIYIADNKGNFVQSMQKPKPATRVIDRNTKTITETWAYRNKQYQVTEKKQITPTYDPRKRTWFMNTKRVQKPYWSDVYIFARTKQPGITVSYPVIDRTKQNISAIVATDISLDRLSIFLKKQKISKNSIVFIVNEKNEVIAYPDVSKTYLIDTKTGKARSRKIDELKIPWITEAFNQHRIQKKNRIDSETEGENYISLFTNFPLSTDKQWKIVIAIPEDDLLGTVYQDSLETVIISGVVLVLSLILVAFISYRFTKPIVLLAKETEFIKDFDLDKVTGVNSRFAEIQMLNNSILGMKTGLEAFKKFVPADLVRQLIQTGKEATPGGEKKELSIFFSDIEGFTTISENIPPEELMINLSLYLNELSKIIKGNKGTIDKFIGDSIMGFWGAPLECSDAPYLTCKAALECQKKLDHLNQAWIDSGKPPLKTRIGIHTGEVIVGNIGSEERLNYTIIGDSVNLGARLEGLNKYYGTRIIISQATYKKVSDRFRCRLLDIVAVKGKSKGDRVYELINSRNEPISPEKKEFVVQYHKAFKFYLMQKWDDAITIFDELNNKYPDDKSVSMLQTRATHFKLGRRQSDILPKNWDGTFVLKNK